MISKQLEIENATGLHARPASEFTNAAAMYKSKVDLEYKGKVLNAKSMISILSAGIEKGSTINVVVDGEDEVEALETLVALVESNFGE